MSVVPRVAVVTFATTTRDKPFKNYEKEIERLRGSALKFNLDFYAYTLDDLKLNIRDSSFNGYTHFRRGVGGWFWKPIVMLHYLENIECDYLIYLDVDCILLKDPLPVIQSLENQFEIAGFRMDAQIKDWTVSRIVGRFQANECSGAAMWTAGILLVKNSEKAKSHLVKWLHAMSKPWNLFELPFEVGGVTHRHDQSVLSILIAKNEIQVFNLGGGFYSEGIESTSPSMEAAWVATGVNFGKPTPNSELSFVMKLVRAIRHKVSKFSKGTFWFAYLFFFIWKKTSDKFD
jgi:hypothetical protein